MMTMSSPLQIGPLVMAQQSHRLSGKLADTSHRPYHYVRPLLLKRLHLEYKCLKINRLGNSDEGDG